MSSTDVIVAVRLVAPCLKSGPSRPATDIDMSTFALPHLTAAFIAANKLHFAQGKSGVVPVVKCVRDFWPSFRGASSLCPEKPWHYRFGLEGPSSLTWVVELHMPRPNVGSWKRFWDHLQAKGATEFAVMCLELGEHRDADGCQLGRVATEYTFDVACSEGRVQTHGELNPDVMARYSPELAMAVHSHFFLDAMALNAWYSDSESESPAKRART